MPITRMNHAVPYVRDAAVTHRFYHDVLGFETVVMVVRGRCPHEGERAVGMRYASVGLA